MSMICEVFLIAPETARELLNDPSGVHDVLEALDGLDDALSLEKSWHGLHFILTGTAWEGDAPLNFLVSGGIPVGEEEIGYGPARIVAADDVPDLRQALSAFTPADFDRNFDRTKLSKAEIYPSIWDEPLVELKWEYDNYLQALKSHVQRAAETGQALLITLR